MAKGRTRLAVAPNRPGSQEHYPYTTRSLLRLYDEGLLTNVTDGSHRVTHGSDLGLNTAAASKLAEDKGYSKFMLRTLGVNCPDGEEFLLPWWEEKISPLQRARGTVAAKSTAMAPEYIEQHHGYPTYVKPVDGSQGAGVYKVHDAGELALAFQEYEQKQVRVAVVEEPIDMPDYRLVVLDGELISAYRRVPLSVTGDGRRTIYELLTGLQSTYLAAGRNTQIDPHDARIAAYLQRKGMSLRSIPQDSTIMALMDISNLSAGGTSEDITDTIPERWVNMAAYITSNFNLRLGGLDLACSDIMDETANHSVLEVNSSPGLNHYAASGADQQRLVDRLYTRVFNAFPSHDT